MKKNFIVLALSGLSILFPLTQLVHAADKQTVGTIRNLQAGDVACYITYIDNKGTEYHEMADFLFCEDNKLIAHKVRFVFENIHVLADSCMGNPNCENTQIVPLIVDIKPIN